jgi:tetratricopeptide (TPR) repeat protein
MVSHALGQPPPAKPSKPAKNAIRKAPKEATDASAHEVDDRLNADDQRMVTELTERRMPELVEEMLAGRPVMYQVHIARAYSRCATDDPDPAFRERCAGRAAEYYEKVLALAHDPKWFRGDRRRFDIAQWQAERADLIIRLQAAADLDRFEITSGLDFDRARLAKRLGEAREAHAASQSILEELLMGLRTDEERFMMLGLTDRLTRLAQQRELAAAWTEVYAGMTAERSDPQRGPALARALTGFDNAARTAGDPATKYNSLIGAGIALREAGRPEEALAALDRVIASTAGAATIARARYEKVRTLLASGRFEAARTQAEAVAAMDGKSKKGLDPGAVFYVRLAPLLSAYSLALHSQARGENSPESQRLMNAALAAFDALSQQGGPWPEIVRVYLRSFEDRPKDPDSLSDAALRGEARRAMTEEKYEDALKLLRILVHRTTLKKESAEDRFNLAVCYFRTGRIRPAAEEFAALAELPGGELSERSAEHAYRCYRQLVLQTRDKETSTRLAYAADVLASRFPGNALATEAVWASGLAFEESGDLPSAIRAYGKIGAGAPSYWNALLGAARCRQALYAGLSGAASPTERQRAAREACGAWRHLARELADAPDDGRAPPNPRDWIAEARISAAAIMLSDELREYKEALELLAAVPPSVEALRLKVAAMRALGDVDGAKKTVDELVKHATDAEVGPALLSLAVDLEARAARLQQMGRAQDAQAAAAEAVPTFQQLLDWLSRRPGREKEIAAARISLGSLLKQAGRLDEAIATLGACMDADPSNGECVRLAALLHEESARTTSGLAQSTALDSAEELWGRLLLDSHLRDNAPAKYWEARYFWLSHQLRRGRAGEVLKGIETEQAWYPELGGPPWQGRLLGLADQARAATGTHGP